MPFVVAQLGARMHYAVPCILHRAGMLAKLYTDICAVKGWPKLLCLVPAALRSPALHRLLGRVPRGLPRDRITAFTSFGLEYARRRAASTPAQTTATHLWAGQTFCGLALSQGLQGASGVYTFNSAGLELLEHARERGLFSVMEQTCAPVEVQDALLAEEQDTFPGWEPTLGTDPYRAEFKVRERSEWECANLILCGSEFVRQGIAHCGGPVERCVVVPYGVDFAAPASLGAEKGSQLRVLIASGVKLQKGAAHVLNAARALKGVAEFRWCGAVGLLPEAASQLAEHVDLRGAVPRPQMGEHYAWADAFLLPSICEGSATVCYEALAAGLPVITTHNAGSIVRDGVDGFIVPIRDAEAIAEKLHFLAANPDLLAEFSRNATARSHEYTVSRYGERLAAALNHAADSNHLLRPS